MVTKFVLIIFAAPLAGSPKSHEYLVEPTQPESEPGIVVFVNFTLEFKQASPNNH